jgi:hypothetical protein
MLLHALTTGEQEMRTNNQIAQSDAAKATAREYRECFGWDVTYSEYGRTARNAELTAAILAQPERYPGHHEVEQRCLEGSIAQRDAKLSEMVAALNSLKKEAA